MSHCSLVSQSGRAYVPLWAGAGGTPGDGVRHHWVGRNACRCLELSGGHDTNTTLLHTPWSRFRGEIAIYTPEGWTDDHTQRLRDIIGHEK